jgi:trehalose 6-phosphate phosphatase
VLSRSAAHILNSFATSNVLLAFDYDGTLAPIVPTPARARMRASTRRLLMRVARVYPSVVISGRALTDISRRLARVPLWYVFGNHGSEPALIPPPLHRTREWVRVLKRELPPDPGVFIENKGHSVTVHYRRVRDREAMRGAIIQVARSLTDVRVMDGSEAINLLRRDAPDKGFALSYAVRAFACSTAVYVGDDGTDEDAFAALPPDRLLSIRVGGGEPTRARFHLEAQSDIDLLLARLLEVRAGDPMSLHSSGDEDSRRN